MIKIVLSKGSIVLREMVLVKDRITIGRHPRSDIRIDDLAISAEHAVIVTLDNDVYLEDLNSTNGTQVNGQPIRKHFLQDEDVIELAQYRLRYMVMDPVKDPEASEFVANARQASTSIARITVLNGANAGHETPLVKALTTFGTREHRAAVIARRADAYYISAVAGSDYLLVNGEAVGSTERQMVDGDLIELSDVKLRFEWAYEGRGMSA